VARVRAEELNTVVLTADETILREFPPLRACWGKVGQPVEVPITGSNARRVVFGALNPFTGTRVCTVAPRNTGPAFRDFLTALRGVYKRWDILLLLDRGSSHIAKATEALAAALRIRLAWLPTACPELNPVEALWRDGKQKVSANRAYADVDEQATRFIDHVCGHSDRTALRLAGLTSGNYWLTT
jgi:transposase